MEMQIDKKNQPVCVFDSGIGGLNLLKECAKKLPATDLVYVADNYNVPYGNLPHERIEQLAIAAFDRIEKLNPAAAVAACNTVTAECIKTLRERYSFPIIGIQPAVKPAQKVGGKCLVLATEATVKSASFKALLKECAPADTTVYPRPELARFIEQNIMFLPDSLPHGLLPDIKADSVVLGCTHYIFVKKHIESKYGCPVFDGVVGTVDHLVTILGKTDHQTDESRKITFIGGNFAKNSSVYSKISGV